MVLRDEAIGVPILPLWQPGHGKVKHSDGYLVQVANRQCVEYVEPHRTAMIEVDFGISVGVYIETLNGWLSKSGISRMSATEPRTCDKRDCSRIRSLGTVELC